MTADRDALSELRTTVLVHAGPMLEEEEEASALGRYLAGETDRQLLLIHHDQPVYRETARAAGVDDIVIDAMADHSEHALAAEMAIALGARELEFAIDRPHLKNVLGDPIATLTLHEAERFAEEWSLRQPIREMLVAACDALERGVESVRIGTPTSLLSRRATVILPDSTPVVVRSTSMAVAVEVAGSLDEDASIEEPKRDPEPDLEPGDLEPDLRKGLEETIQPVVEALEKRYLEALLDETEGRIQQAAEIARISRRTLQRKLAAYGIDKTDFRRPRADAGSKRRPARDEPKASDPAGATAPP